MSKYTKEIEKRITFAIISHPDAGKTEPLIWPVVLKERQRPAMQYQTGWKLKRREVFPLLLPYCSSIMTVTASTFWILLDIRISQRILIVP